VTPPSQIIDDVMAGKIELKDQSLAIQSACSFYIYEVACETLAPETKQERQKVLATLPDKLIPHVRAEAENIWRKRNDYRVRNWNSNGRPDSTSDSDWNL
jgi:hypothetical protein